MNSQISPKYYYSQEIFDKEQKNIFSKNWVFFGFSHDFQNHNDFKTLKINNLPIVVQNCKGEIKAF